jgi:hypothetical protein
MCLEHKSPLLGDGLLAALDRLINELVYSATLGTNKMIMMRTLIELKDGALCVECVTNQDIRISKLHQYPVHGRQDDVNLLIRKQVRNIIRRKMLSRMFMEQLQHPYSRKRSPQTTVSNLFWYIHDINGRSG